MNQCRATVNPNAPVVGAEFTLPKLTVTVVSGAALVTSEPAGISCGLLQTCTATFNTSSVRLRAVPVNLLNPYFSWSVPCSNNPCDVPLTQAETTLTVRSK
jgi:hypothetical protein